MRDTIWLATSGLARAERDFTFDNAAFARALSPWALEHGGGDVPVEIIAPPFAELTGYSLTASPTTVAEGNQVTFTISRSGDKPAETVYFSTLSDGTATYAEGDYTTTSGGQPLNIAVSFSAGTTSKTVKLNIVSDGVSDSGEQFRAIVQRNASDPVSTYLDRSSYVTINDPASSTTYSLTASPSTVTEGNQVTFTISRSGDKPAETIYFSTLSDGTATYGEGDYTTSSGGQPANIAVSFSSGTTSRTVTLNIVSDGVSDSGEQFRAIVQRSSSDPVSTYLDRSSYVTINDAGASTTYSLTASPATVIEGNQVTFTVTRSGDKPAETVYFSTLSDGTGTYAEGDYTTTSGGQPANIAVNFSSGETSETVTLNIVNDGVSDSGEQFRAIVQRNASDPVSTYLDRSPFVTINDPAAQNTTFTITPASTSVIEDSQLVFTISRSGNMPDQTVFFSTWQDSATFGEGDYRLSTGGEPLNVPIHFVAGDPTETITLSILQDNQADAGERFRAIVQGNPPALDPAINLAQTAFITINEGPIQNTTYSLSVSSTSVTEGEQITFSITRVGDKPPETIYFSTLLDGTANFSEGDYTTLSNGMPLNVPVTFASGSSSQAVTLNIKDDHVADSGEQFRAIIQRFGANEPVSSYLDRSAYMTILDAPVVTPPPGTSPLLEFIRSHTPVAGASSGAPDSLLRLPVEAGTVVFITQGAYGPDSHYANTAITAVDFAVTDDAFEQDPDGISVTAMAPGVIVRITETIYEEGDESPGQLGNFITVLHTIIVDGQPRSFYATYAHLASEIGTRWGGQCVPVAAGQVLGKMGLTGTTSGPHVHVQVGWRTDYRGFADGQANSENGETPNQLMALLHFAEGNIDWPLHSDLPLPSLESQNSFSSHTSNEIIHGTADDSLWDSFVHQSDDYGTVASIAAHGLDAVFSAADSARQFILDAFEDIRAVGGAFADTLNILPLAGTTIQTNTIYFDGGAGNDTVNGSKADRRVVAEGGVGDDSLIGGSADDSLDGSEGSDLLDGGLGADTMIGGPGNDAYFVDNPLDYVDEVAGGGSDTVIASVSYTLAAGQHIELLRTLGSASTYAVSLGGNSFANTILGNAAANAIDGKGGADTMWGYAGNDTYYLDLASDRAFEAAGGGYDTVITNTSYALTPGQAIERLTTYGSATTAAINLTGNEFANAIAGNAAANTIDGKGGADAMYGYAGYDTYHVDSALDYVAEAAGGGFDTVIASASYTLAPGQAIELLRTLGSASTYAVSLGGNAFANTITGNAAANVLDGGGGADTMYGHAGNDIFYVDHGSDLVVEAAGGGADTVIATVSYALRAGQAIEVLRTWGSSTTAAVNLTGNELANSLVGNAAANLLDGKGGNDTLWGHAGADRFAFTTALAAANVDRIGDFQAGVDKIVLENAVFAGLAPGALAAAAFRTGAAAQDSSDRIVYNSATGALLFDPDGAGGAAAVQFATLQPGLAIAASDFTVI